MSELEKYLAIQAEIQAIYMLKDWEDMGLGIQNENVSYDISYKDAIQVLNEISEELEKGSLQEFLEG